MAAENDCFAVAEFLIRSGAKVNANDDVSSTLIIIAISLRLP